MSVTKFYIRYEEDMPALEMFYIAQKGFQERGVETAPFFGFGDIDDLDDLGHDVGISGYIGDVWAALDKLGIERPPSLDYPSQLTDWLGRDFERTTLGAIRNRMNPGIFCKPVKQKLFTGFVFTGSYNDKIRLAPYPDEEEVWLCGAINFVSEYRCFILHDEVISVRHYKGDWSIALSRIKVEEAVRAYLPSPCAYTLDFGITDKGTTILVEVNDGFAVGTYGLPPALYAKMLEARWQELTER